MSVPQLQFTFNTALPDLTGKRVVDVGSRLGAVLYGVCLRLFASTHCAYM